MKKKRKNSQGHGKTQLQRDYSSRGRAGLLTPIAETNRVNAASKTGAAAVITRQNDPSWYDRYPSISQVAIPTFMPYSSIPMNFGQGNWRPQHITSHEMYIGMGTHVEARNLALGELWNDIRSKLKSNLAYSYNDMCAYVQTAHFCRLVAKSAEAWLRMAITATANDPKYTASLLASKFAYSTVDGALADISSYAPLLRFTLDNFATWMINTIPCHDAMIARIDMLENNVFLENPDPDAPVCVISLWGRTYMDPQNPTKSIVYRESLQNAASIISIMNRIMAEYPAVFLTIQADLRNAYGDAINQAWDFSLKDYTFSAVFDDVIKQQLKNAEEIVVSVAQGSPAVNVHGTFDIAGWTSYNDTEYASEQLVDSFNGALSGAIFPTRHEQAGFAEITQVQPSFYAPRQYLVSVDRQFQIAGTAIETTHLMSTFKVFIQNDGADLIVAYNNGPEVLVGQNSIFVNTDGTISKKLLIANTVFVKFDANASYSILSNSWSEITALGSLILVQGDSKYGMGNVSYDKITVVPDINLDQMQYAATASLYRTVASF